MPSEQRRGVIAHQELNGLETLGLLSPVGVEVVEEARDRSWCPIDPDRQLNLGVFLVRCHEQELAVDEVDPQLTLGSGCSGGCRVCVVHGVSSLGASRLRSGVSDVRTMNLHETCRLRTSIHAVP